MTALSEREMRVLSFERHWWRQPGAKEQAISDQLGLSATRYYQMLNELIDGATADLIESRLARLDPGNPHAQLLAQVGERILRVLRDYDRTAVEEVFSDGLLNVMGAPEFAHSEKLRRVFTALENRAYLGQLVGSVAESGRVTVYIGEENEAPDMREVALVLAPYGRPGIAVGVVGVLGPTRLAYPEAIGTVRFVSGLMNELVDHLYH